jgi:hypothetical protein
MFGPETDGLFAKLTSLYRELNPKYRKFLFKELELLLDMQDEDSER